MLKIVKDTQKSLREKCVEVEMPLSQADKDTLDEMLQYLKDSQNEEFRAQHKDVREGVGLAAPQIGINKRMLVIHYEGAKEGEYVTYQLVNPKIVANSIKQCYLSNGEGCLSVDNDHPGHVYRSFRIDVKAYDAYTGQDVKITARGFDAIVLQHEIDHLSGRLYYDHIDPKDPMKVIPGSVEI